MRARSSGGYDWTDPDDMDPPMTEPTTAAGRALHTANHRPGEPANYHGLCDVEAILAIEAEARAAALSPDDPEMRQALAEYGIKVYAAAVKEARASSPRPSDE